MSSAPRKPRAAARNYPLSGFFAKHPRPVGQFRVNLHSAGKSRTPDKPDKAAEKGDRKNAGHP
jgi:hypothetical protein